MDPVTTAAVVVAVISSAGTVLAAWVQGRAQRPAGGGQQVTNRHGQPSADGGDQPGDRVRVPT